MAMKKEIIQTRNRKMNKKLIIKVRETFFLMIRRVADTAYHCKYLRLRVSCKYLRLRVSLIRGGGGGGYKAGFWKIF
jgi:hypothetical protein